MIYNDILLIMIFCVVVHKIVRTCPCDTKQWTPPPTVVPLVAPPAPLARPGGRRITQAPTHRVAKKIATRPIYIDTRQCPDLFLVWTRRRHAAKRPRALVAKGDLWGEGATMAVFYADFSDSVNRVNRQSRGNRNLLVHAYILHVFSGEQPIVIVIVIVIVASRREIFLAAANTAGKISTYLSRSTSLKDRRGYRETLRTIQATNRRRRTDPLSAEPRQRRAAVECYAVIRTMSEESDPACCRAGILGVVGRCRRFCQSERGTIRVREVAPWNGLKLSMKL